MVMGGCGKPRVKSLVWHWASLVDVGDTYVCHSFLGGNVEIHSHPSVAVGWSSMNPVLSLLYPVLDSRARQTQVMDFHREPCGRPPFGASTSSALLLPVVSSNFTLRGVSTLPPSPCEASSLGLRSHERETWACSASRNKERERQGTSSPK
jgi:hypothetical protein